MSDTLTLMLEGTITLSDFAKAVEEFDGLVRALSNEVTAGAQIEWVIHSLQGNSATATVRGEGQTDKVETVVRAYETMGERLSRAEALPFSPAVQQRARGLVNLIGGKIEFIRFETDQRDALIRRESAAALLAPPEASAEDAYGAVEGAVETLTRRGGLRFTLYDIVNNKAVSCYLSPGHEDIMRDVWGKRAVVFGRVHRDPLTGRALSVRQVTSVDVVKQGNKGDWRQARGAAPLAPGVSSVEAIRAVRNG